MENLSITSTIELNDGQRIPALGFGVFQLDGRETCEPAVGAALEAGYRHIDTAYVYGNEQHVGAAVAASGIPRRDVFITTKTVFDHGPDSIRKGLAGSLDRLRTDYVDLLLIHWPLDDKGLPGAWETLLQLQGEGLCRSVGVSNITVRRFEEVLFKHSDRAPAVNQIELHLYNQRPALVEYCRRKGIVLEAYSPLARARKLADPGRPILDVADACGRSVAQVMLRFLLQEGFVTLVKSQTPSRIRENAEIFDFELTDAQMATLRTLNEDLTVLNWTPGGYY